MKKLCKRSGFWVQGSGFSARSQIVFGNAVF